MSYLIATISGITTAVVLHFLARRRDKHTEFNRAADKFREAFMQEMMVLDPDNTKEVKTVDILEKAFLKHKFAYIEFKHFLRCCELTRFNLAWHKCYYHDQWQHPFPDQYIDKNGRQRAFQRFNKLLSFAEPKNHIFSKYLKQFKKV